jgi:predicted short-subunit dehydrogenase-like oxidoreductase (DUF2520 family)
VGLGLALSRAGHRVLIHGQRSKDLPVPLELTWGGVPPWLPAVEVVLLAVPDDELARVAAELAASGGITERHTILHLSGVLDRSVLQPLSGTGAALGSMHPLQSLSDPLRAPERLKGAVAAVEGDAHAVDAASELARTVGLRPVVVHSERKAVYHAGAVFASNYLVVVATIAERLLVDAGFTERDARAALAPLIAGTLGNLREQGAGGLTGPVARGDAQTVRRHLEALPEDVREPYRALARAALEIAKLPEERRRMVEAALGATG